MSNKIYELQTCNSIVTLVNENDLKANIKLFENAFIVVWYQNSIKFYKIENKKCQVPLDEFSTIVRLRIFDEKKELHVWRSNGILIGRLREDAEGDKIEYIIAKQLLNSSLLFDEGDGIDNINRKFLKTRNYIGYSDDITQAGYIDCRFVGFENDNLHK
jgi:hypothetical protein